MNLLDRFVAVPFHGVAYGLEFVEARGRTPVQD